MREQLKSCLEMGLLESPADTISAYVDQTAQAVFDLYSNCRLLLMLLEGLQCGSEVDGGQW
jgi:hypothetical protein